MSLRACESKGFRLGATRSSISVYEAKRLLYRSTLTQYRIRVVVRPGPCDVHSNCDIPQRFISLTARQLATRPRPLLQCSSAGPRGEFTKNAAPAQRWQSCVAVGNHLNRGAQRMAELRTPKSTACSPREPLLSSPLGSPGEPHVPLLPASRPTLVLGHVPRVLCTGTFSGVGGKITTDTRWARYAHKRYALASSIPSTRPSASTLRSSSPSHTVETALSCDDPTSSCGCCCCCCCCCHAHEVSFEHSFEHIASSI
eukprot:1039533-Rhodomonas_salina.1